MTNFVPPIPLKSVSVVFQSAATFVAAFCISTTAAAQTANVAPPAAQPAAASASFVTVGERPAILYDALSTKSNRLFILSPRHPLELLVRLTTMTKVRDAEGTVGWVENKDLGDRKHVQVNMTQADVRASANATSALVFEAQRGVLLEVLAPTADGWVAVRHRDGQGGFIRAAHVFGG